jgi:hypothetical protein
MKKLPSIIIILITILISFSCRKHSARKLIPLSDDSFVFGHYYGECEGEMCVEIFRIKDYALYEDIKDNYPDYNKPYNGNFVKLSDDKFEMVKDLESKIPPALLSEPNRVIGQPDAGDWGGYYLELSKNGERSYWYIDKMKSHLPAYLVPFVDELSASIEKLK